MDWGMVKRNWKPFTSKVKLLLDKLSDEHLDALFARRVDGSTNDRIGPQVEYFEQQKKA